MTLTEQWKKGELEDGIYWVMLDVSGDGKIMQTTLSISNGKPVGWCKKSIKQVLAPVPSYEEWQELLLDNKILKQCQEIDFGTAYTETIKTKAENQQLKEDNRIFEEKIHNSYLEIGQLKELLKECVEVLNDAQRNYGYDDSIIDICSPIITKIDEVFE